MASLRRGAAYLGLALVLAAAVVQWVVPAAIERVASTAVSSWLGPGDYRVRVDAAPRVGLLLGRFDRLEIEGTGLAAAGVVDRLVVRLEDVRINPWRLLVDRRLDRPRARRLAFRVELRERDLARHLRAELPFDDLTVRLRDGGFELQGRVSVGTGSTRIAMKGAFTVDPEAPRQVRLTVDAMRVNDREVPGFLVEQVLALILAPDLALDLERWFPVPVRITAVDVEEGRLIVDGEAEP